MSDKKLIYPYGRYAENEYLTWLNHKDVIIVGPAGYLMGQGRGEWIDSYEIVVRVNHALPIEYPDDYGTRTDVLYHILSRLGINRSKKLTIGPKEIELWKDNIKWLVCRHHSISQRALKMGPIIDGAFPWICMDYSFYRELKRTIGEKAPNTGIAAIMHILLSKVRSLTVVGFDFYRSGVYPGYGDIKKEEDARVVNDKWHSTEAQIEYFKKVVARDNRIIIDSHLKEILADEETS